MNDLYINHYPSVTALRVEAQQTPYTLDANRERAYKAITSDNARFLGIEGGAPAVLKALVNGYPAGEQAVREFHDSIAATLPRALGHSRTKVRGSFGDELDVHAINRGQFDRAWTSSARRVRAGSGVLRLIVDVCANGQTDADALRWRGIAGLALSEVMNKAGYAVEIVAGMGVAGFHFSKNKNKPRKCALTITVKPTHTQADLGLLAATVGLPGFFRSLGFAAVCRAADKLNEKVNNSIGQYLDISGVLPVPDRVTQLFVPQSVISKETAVKWVNQSITLLQGSHA